MSSTTNTAINSRSMNGIISITDGVAILEDGDLNCDDINSSSLSANNITTSLLNVTGKFECNSDGPYSIPTSISSITGLLIGYGNTTNSGATDFLNFQSSYTSTQGGFRFWNKSATQTLTNLAIIDNSQTYFSSPLTGCLAETPLNPTSVVNKTYTDSNFMFKTGSVTESITGNKTFSGSLISNNLTASVITGTQNIYTNNTTGTINIGTGQTTGTINIGTNQTTGIINIGNETSTTDIKSNLRIIDRTSPFTNRLIINQNVAAASYTSFAGNTTATTHNFWAYDNTGLQKNAFTISYAGVSVLEGLTFSCRQIRSSNASSGSHELFSNMITGGVLTIGSLTSNVINNSTTTNNAQHTFNNFAPISNTAPSSPNHLTTKSYVDGILNSNNIWGGTNSYTYLPTSTATPSNPSDLTTKAYVDGMPVHGILNSNNIWGGTNSYTYLPTSTATPSNPQDLTTKSFTDATYQTISNMTNYLTTATASTTYQTIANMTNYLTTATASTTYQTIANMTNYLTTATASTTYLTITTASSTYQTIANMTNYLTTATASTTYQTIANMTNYLTTATASTTYQTIANMVNYANLSNTNTFSNTNVFNAQTTFNNTTPFSNASPPTANNHLTRKDYVDTNFMFKSGTVAENIGGIKTFTNRVNFNGSPCIVATGSSEFAGANGYFQINPNMSSGSLNPASQNGTIGIVGLKDQTNDKVLLTLYGSIHASVKLNFTEGVSIGFGGSTQQANTSVICDGTNVIIKPNIKFSGDNTIQNSAFTGAGSLNGTYGLSNITIDMNGKITSLSSGLTSTNTFTNTNTFNGSASFNAQTYFYNFPAFSYTTPIDPNHIPNKNYCDTIFQTIANMTNYLTTATAATTYLTIATAATTYQTIAGMSSYLTITTAATTYQTIANMTNYLTITTAATTYQTIANMSNYLTTATAATTYQTIANMTNYLTTATASTTYLTITTAATTYQTIANMTNYLTTATAATTYQTIANMTNYLTTATASTTYLTITTASSTYQTIAGMSSYLLASTAASTYQTIANMSNYLTTATAATTYLTIATASTTYQTIANMTNYLTTATASTTYQTIANMTNYVNTTTGQNIGGDKTFTNYVKTKQGLWLYDVMSPYTNFMELSLSGTVMQIVPSFYSNSYEIFTKDGVGNDFVPITINNASTTIDNQLICNDGAVFNNTLPTTSLTPSSPNHLTTKTYVDSTFHQIIVGSIIQMAMGTVPTGYLACNGGSYSSSTYPALSAFLNFTYGGSAPSGLFKVPDFRGMFLRGAGTNGIDSAYASAGYGSLQTDGIKSHTHDILFGYNPTVQGSGGSFNAYSSTSPNYNNPGTGSGRATGLTSNNANPYPDTRPGNFAVLFCIKY